jgi:hypothetical protein
MTDYKTIRGKKIKSFATDLGNDQAEGQIFYSSTDNEFKTAVASAAWHSSANVITARRTAASAGTQTANFIAGGFIPGFVASTEEYNGTGWTAGGDMPASSYAAFGAGTQTAGLVYGGSTDPNGQEGITTTIEYNGSSWTAGGALSQKRWNSSAGAGTQTAALASTGYNDGNVTNSEEYNGSSWTAGNAIDTAKRGQGQCGTQTASVLFGGIEPPGSRVATVEEYDGTNYSSATSLPANRSDMGASGTQTAALGFAGYIDPGRSTNTFLYDGTSWTAQPNLATAIDGGGGSRGGTSSAALSSTGTAPPGLTKATEEFNITANTVTAGAWASGGNLNTGGRAGAAGSGIQTASIIAGGGLGTVLNNTESYNGSSWTNLPTLGTARGYMAGATNAPYTATVVFGGATGPGGPYVGNSEEYSGSSWSEGNDLNNARGYLAGFGTQTAAAAAGGTAPNPSPPSRQSHVEEYNGSSWSEVTDVPAAANAWGGCGTQTAGLVIGDVPMKGLLYDGTNWTTIPTLNSQGNYNKVFGTTASAMTCGRNPGKGNDVEEWNGTTWFTQASLATPRFNGGQTGTTTAGLVAGSPTATEEFTAETTALNLKTITDS